MMGAIQLFGEFQTAAHSDPLKLLTEGFNLVTIKIRDHAIYCYNLRNRMESSMVLEKLNPSLSSPSKDSLLKIAKTTGQFADEYSKCC